MSADREALRESVARAIEPDAFKLPRTRNLAGVYARAEAALAAIIPACQDTIRDRAPATQDMRSTEICDALDAAADALAVFLPEKTDG